MKKKKLKRKRPVKCLLADKLYIKVQKGMASEFDAIANLYTHEIVPINSPCHKCRARANCDECAARPQIVETFDSYTHDGQPIVTVPRGDLVKLRKVFKILGRVALTDRRVFKAHPDLKRLSWNYDYPLFDYQKKALREFFSKKNKGIRSGIIHARARSGKTVIASALITYLKTPTLFLAHRDRLLKQFIKAMRKFTDISEQERFLGRPLIGYVSDFRHRPLEQNPPVMVSSLQLFIDKPKLLEKYKNRFGMTILDECHHVAAECFSLVYNNFNPLYRLGLTATPGRKDGFDPVIFDITGKVIVGVESEALKCLVDIIQTGHKIEKFSHWPTFLRRLANDNNRNKLIVNKAVEDVKNGRYVLIVTARVDHLLQLTKAINEELDCRDEPCAVAWYSKTDKLYGDDIHAKCDSGAYKVVVATRDFIKEGIDCALWDTYYCITPSANPYDYYQEVSRIRTPRPGKKPIIRYFLDDGSAAYSCLRIASKVHDKEGFVTMKKGSAYQYGKPNQRKPLSSLFFAAPTTTSKKK